MIRHYPTPINQINLEENNSYYDNNYWCMNILEVALDDII